MYWESRRKCYVVTWCCYVVFDSSEKKRFLLSPIAQWNKGGGWWELGNDLRRWNRRRKLLVNIRKHTTGDDPQSAVGAMKFKWCLHWKRERKTFTTKSYYFNSKLFSRYDKFLFHVHSFFFLFVKRVRQNTQRRYP